MPTLSIFGSLIIISFLGMREAKNVHSLRDFAFSKGAFSSLTLTTTIVASFIGGGVVIGTAEKCYLLGIAPVLGLLGFALQLFLTGQLIAKRIYRFDNFSSLGEILSKNYGQTAKLLLGLCWTFFCVGLLAAQMVALGRILSLFVPISPQITNFLASSFLIFYCLLGGIRAVVITDRLQFWLIITIVPTLLGFLVYLLFKTGYTSQDIPTGYLSPFSKMSPLQLGSLFLGFLLGDALIPPVIQRVQLAKHYFQAKKALIVSAVIVFLFTFVCGALGIFMYMLKPNLDSTQLIPTLFNQFLPVPVQIFGAIAILAVIMSSADSYLNSLAFVFVKDVYQPLKKKELSDQKALIIARWSTLTFGFLAFALSIYGKNSYDLLLNTYKFWGPLMFIPILYTLLNQKISKRGFYINLLTSLLSVVFWDFFGLEQFTSISSLIFGILVSFVTFNILLVIRKSTAEPHRAHHKVV